MPSITATVVAFDLTTKNAIGWPYVLQHRLAGTALDEVYSTMNTSDKIDIAQQVASLLVTMDSISFPAIGNIVALSEPTETWNAPGIPVSVESQLRIVEVDTKSSSQWHSQTHIPPPTRVEAFFERQFAERIPVDGEKVCNFAGVELHSWSKLLVISREMKKLGYFAPDESTSGIVHHWDFEPRNILAEPQPASSSFDESSNSRSERWKVTGIIDWDDALSYPRILARKPPIWLWNDIETFGLYHVWINDDGSDKRIYDQWDYDLDTAPPLPLTKDDFMIKCAFDAIMEKHLPGYCYHAYEAGKMVRRLANFAKLKGLGTWDKVKYDRFLVEWKAERSLGLEKHSPVVSDSLSSMSILTRNLELSVESSEPDTYLGKATPRSQGDST